MKHCPAVRHEPPPLYVPTWSKITQARQGLSPGEGLFNGGRSVLHAHQDVLVAGHPGARFLQGLVPEPHDKRVRVIQPHQWDTELRSTFQ